MFQPTLRKAGRRSGFSMAMYALLMPMMIGLLALSVDLGIKEVAMSQLQTVADAAALAGAAKLATDNRLIASYAPTAEMTSARTQAASIGGRNAVLHQAATVSSGDVTIGYLNPLDISSSMSQSDPTQFNSVQVTAYRNSSHGGQVPTFFSKIFGKTGMDASSTSTATIQTYAIQGVKSVNGANADVLPIVMHVDAYTEMLNPTIKIDDYKYDSTTKTVVSGSDGAYEGGLYPIRTTPGNWGTINIGVSNNSTSTLGSQIVNGITPSQLAQYPNSTIQAGTFDGNPGISSGIKDDLTSIIGQTRWLPIYNGNASGNGNNTTYNVIYLRAVRVMAVSFQGKNKYVIVQPAIKIDSNAVAQQQTLPWTTGGLIQLHLSR